MGLPGHRRTSSDKRRRAAHFALTKPTVATDKKTGATHLGHRAAPGALEYNGHKIHRKGTQRKLEKLIKKAETAHDHDHADHKH